MPLQELQIFFCEMMLVAGTAVDPSVHIRLHLHIQFPQTVKDHMHMNITAPVMSVVVGTHDNLVSRKASGSKFHPELLGSLRSQPAFVLILRIKA